MTALRLSIKYLPHALLCAVGAAALAGGYFILPSLRGVTFGGTVNVIRQIMSTPTLDTRDYDARLLALAHVATSSPWYRAFLADTTTPLDAQGNATTTSTPRPQWPIRQPYPNYGALLPFNRIIAYYGNYYSTGMGVLGEYDPSAVLQKLQNEVQKWQAADPSTPVIPAIEYIDVTAQGSAGKDGTYRARMPDSQIDKSLQLADTVHGIVILDIQVGLSTLQDELPLLTDYLAKPAVHLAIDPEFSMKDGIPPGDEIGTFNAADINYAINFLSDIVKKNNLPPKILVVHRFTEEMIIGYRDIKPTPQVQVVVDMDGWGYPEKKLTTYNSVVAPEPVQFTGIKLFYKNDTKAPSTGLLSTSTILNLTPAPVYIQYQ